MTEGGAAVTCRVAGSYRPIGAPSSFIKRRQALHVDFLDKNDHHNHRSRGQRRFPAPISACNSCFDSAGRRSRRPWGRSFGRSGKGRRTSPISISEGRSDLASRDMLNRSHAAQARHPRSAARSGATETLPPACGTSYQKTVGARVSTDVKAGQAARKTRSPL